MKKVTALLLAILMLASISVVSFAETKTFDPSVLSGLSNYEYDKFDKTFYYYEAYVEEYRDADVVIGMDICRSSN